MYITVWNKMLYRSLKLTHLKGLSGIKHHCVYVVTGKGTDQMLGMQSFLGTLLWTICFVLMNLFKWARITYSCTYIQKDSRPFYPLLHLDATDLVAAFSALRCSNQITFIVTRFHGFNFCVTHRVNM